MKIGVDAREIQNGVTTGIGRSLANFLEYFCQNERKHSITLFADKKINLNFNNKIEQILVKSSSTFLWDQVKLPIALKTNKIEFYYSPYYKIPLFTSIPSVNQILDLMFLEFRPYRHELSIFKKLYYSIFGRAFAKKAVGIITDSEHAKQDIIRSWCKNSNKIRVIPLGLASRYKQVKDLSLTNKVKMKLNLPDKFILYLGNFKPHKNVASLVKAFKKLRNGKSNYKLVLAGPLCSHGFKIKDLVTKEGINERVIFTDTIREKDYPEVLLSLADVFVFPSLYEGFGLPPLEAMACGTAVVASNLTSIPEVVGNAGILINPLDVDAISKALDEIIEKPEKRACYVKKGLERAKQFREKDTTEKLYNYIISLLEKRL